jgi:type II secretory pathway pseudopilin PulG
MTRTFTLLEVLLVVLIMGLMASTLLLVVENSEDQQRYDESKRRLQQIKKAITGPESFTTNGPPILAGYIADTGQLPDTVNDLLEAPDPAVPGWNGPYLTSLDQDSSENIIFWDGWGNEFVIVINSNVMTITSKGKNNESDVSDSDYDRDLSIKINLNNDLSLKLKDAQTRQRLEQLKYAIKGPVTTNVDAAGSYTSVDGQLAIYGYAKDTSKLPQTIQSFFTDPAVTGWEGPYLTSSDKDSLGNKTLLDGWGNEFDIDTSVTNQLIITSRGKDNVIGGSDYDEDLSITLIITLP